MYLVPVGCMEPISGGGCSGCERALRVRLPFMIFFAESFFAVVCGETFQHGAPERLRRGLFTAFAVRSWVCNFLSALGPCLVFAGGGGSAIVSVIDYISDIKQQPIVDFENVADQWNNCGGLFARQEFASRRLQIRWMVRAGSLWGAVFEGAAAGCCRGG